MSPPGRAAAPGLGTEGDGQSGWQARLDLDGTADHPHERRRPELIPPCRWCGIQTLNAVDGQPGHPECAPADVGLTDRPTSRHASKDPLRIRSQLARAVLDLLKLAPDGLTDDELHRLMPDQLLGSIAKRRLSLVRRGLVVDTGRVRATRRGCDAVVWAAHDRAPAGGPATDVHPEAPPC